MAKGTRGRRAGRALRRVASSGLVVALACGLLVLSDPPAHAAGDPWSPVTDPVVDELDVTLNAVVVLDPEVEPETEEEEIIPVVAVGDGGTVIRSEDSGGTWEAITVPSPPGGGLPGLRDVHFPSPTTGYAVGGSAEGSDGAVYRTDDAGRTWQLKPSSAFSDVSLYGVWFTSADVGHAVGQTGASGNGTERARILRTTDGGESWQAVQARGERSHLRAVSFFDSDRGVAVGLGPTQPPTNLSGLILRTTDGGESWDTGAVDTGAVDTGAEVDESRFPGPLLGVGWATSTNVSDSRAYAVGSATSAASAVGGQIWRSDDEGTTWLPEGSGAALRLRDVEFLDEDHGHAVGGGANVPLILETEDGGETWTANPIIDPEVSSYELRDVAYAREGVRFAVGTQGKVLRYTPDAGPEAVVESIVDPSSPTVPPPDSRSRCPSWDPTSSTTGKATMFEEGTLERAADDNSIGNGVNISVDGTARLLYEVEDVSVHRGVVGSAPPRARVWARDLDTLCLLPDPVLLEDAADDHIAYAPVTVPVVDEEEGRLFLVHRRGPSELYRRSHPTEPDLRFSQRTDLGVAVIGTETQGAGKPPTIEQAAAAAFPPPPGSASAIGSVVAATYHPPQDGSDALSRAKLYVVLERQSQGATGNVQLGSNLVFLYQLDVQRLMEGNPLPFDWVSPVLGCARATVDLAGARRSAVVRAGRHVAMSCGQGRVNADAQQGTVGGVARVELDDLANPAATRFFPADGALTSQPTLADPASGRLFIGAKTRRGTGLAGFDVARGAWFGFIPEERRINMLAVNRHTGRLYMAVDGRHIVVSDARSLDLPQGTTVTELVNQQFAATPVDWKRGRLFTIGSSRELTVLRDAAPFEEPPPPFDPDTLTSDVEEVEGLTGKTFSGGGQAYGVRVRWVNGSRGVQDQSLFCGSGPLPGPFNRPGLSYCPHGGTRELTLAQIPGANLADSEASAEAVGAEHDGAGRQEGTDRDLATLTFEEPDELLLSGGHSEEPDPREQLVEEYRKFKDEQAPDEYDTFRDNRRANTVPNRWPYHRVSCADFGGSSQEDVASADGAVLSVPTGPNEEDRQSVPATFSSSSVTCDQQGELVAAGAVFGDEGQLGPPDESPFIDAGSTRTSAISFLDSERGLVSRVKAEVTGLRLAHPDHGEASIGLLRTVAETRASGRSDPGAGGSFERHIEDVWVRRASDPEPQRLCDQCDPEVVVAELNRVFGSRAHFDLPEPDPERIEGTPGGAEAVITRHPQEQTSDVVTNEESTDRLEVPGLLVTVFADEPTGFSRYIVQVAGVAADSKFSVFCLFGDNPAGGCNAAPPVPGPPTEPDSESPPAPPIDGGPEAAPRGEGSTPAGEEFEVVILGDDPVAGSVGPVASGPQAAALTPELPAEGGPSALIRRVIEGFRFIWNSLIEALRSAALWSLFAAPLVLAARRRWLPAPRPEGGR